MENMCEVLLFPFHYCQMHFSHVISNWLIVNISQLILIKHLEQANGGNQQESAY